MNRTISALNIDTKPSEIQKLFENSTILITGATGFIGKCLLNKLLLTCPGINKIFIIGRVKKDKDIQQRMDEQFNDKFFDQLNEELPNFREKLVIIAGDLTQERLGLSDDDINRIHKEVNTVFHVAATVRFDEKLGLATKINIRATKDLMQIIRNCKSIRAVVHVSTAYSHCYLKEIEEKFFTAVRDPNEFLRYIESHTDEEIDAETPKIIKDYPNTYTFTKGLGEEIVRLEGKDLPIAVYRPSIVMGALKEPTPGYTSNFNGPNGMAIAVGIGLLHVIAMPHNKGLDLVPVDMVVNSMIASALQASKRDKKQPVPIFNFVIGASNPIQNKPYHDWMVNFARLYASTHTFWYYTLNYISNKHAYNILSYIMESLPAIIADKLLLIQGKKPQMKKLIDKIHKGHDLIAYFATREWKFIDNNLVKMWNELGKKDKELFPFDVTKIEWDTYAYHYVRYCRIYLLNDPLSSLKEAQKKFTRFKFLHYTLLTLFWTFCAYLLYTITRRIFL